MNSTAIDCLPPEMISKILENLNLDDLINCKLVCKQWYSIVQLVTKLTKLVVTNDYDGEDKFHKSRWYHSNELIDPDSEHCELSSFLTHFNKNILSNLKKLNINVKLPSTFDLNQLNLFTKLIHLEIDYEFKERCNLNLNLSNLEMLYLGIANNYFHLSIECPKLRILHYSGSYGLRIRYPESIKVLHLKSNLGEKLALFKNVEYLKLHYGNFIEIKNETTLRNLRNIKEINYGTCISNIISRYDRIPTFIQSISSKRSIFRDFLKLAKELKMSDLKLNVAGLQVTEHNIDLIDFGLVRDKFGNEDINHDNFYAANYEYLQDSLPFVHQVDYNKLLKSFRQIPKDYFTKFFAIKRVMATGSIDQKHFLWFLKNLDCLKELNLKRVNLTQSFFDELPTFCSLTYFVLVIYLDLNFDFVSKFTRLNCLLIHQNLKLNSALSLIKAFKNLKYLNALYFHLGCVPYRIPRDPKDSNRYDVIFNQLYASRILEKDLNLDGVVRYFEELK